MGQRVLKTKPRFIYTTLIVTLWEGKGVKWRFLDEVFTSVEKGWFERLST